MFDIVEEWMVWGGRRVRANPTCQMDVGDIGDDTRCGRPATTRVNYWPHWSEFWCAEHATAFDEPPERHEADYLKAIGLPPSLDVPTYLRRAS